VEFLAKTSPGGLEEFECEKKPTHSPLVLQRPSKEIDLGGSGVEKVCALFFLSMILMLYDLYVKPFESNGESLTAASELP